MTYLPVHYLLWLLATHNVCIWPIGPDSMTPGDPYPGLIMTESARYFPQREITEERNATVASTNTREIIRTRNTSLEFSLSKASTMFAPKVRERYHPAWFGMELE